MGHLNDRAAANVSRDLLAAGIVLGYKLINQITYLYSTFYSRNYHRTSPCLYPLTMSFGHAAGSSELAMVQVTRTWDVAAAGATVEAVVLFLKDILDDHKALMI